jgi:DNA processing protein
MLALSIRTLIRVGAAMDQIDLLAMCRVPGVVWHFLAREAQRPEGMERLRAGHATEESGDAAKSLGALAAARDNLGERLHTVEEMLEGAKSDGIELTTVLDEDYPVNLRTIFNLPPFLFYQGTLRPDDALSVAVVGTRQATADGLSRADRMARLLVGAGVTVLSGLALGIDTVAHRACLDAGGRTIAVLGSGIRRVYPPENETMAARIAEHGAIVSQFWPNTHPTSYTFPRRNVVTSGMSQGTVVIEASATSGAKMQARLAIEHGKQVFLLHSLVTEREWAQRYLERPRVHEVSDVADILRLLRPAAEQRNRAMERVQLPLTLFLRWTSSSSRYPASDSAGSCLFYTSGPAELCFACARRTMEPLATTRCTVCDRPYAPDENTCGNPAVQPHRPLVRAELRHLDADRATDGGDQPVQV